MRGRASWGEPLTVLAVLVLASVAEVALLVTGSPSSAVFVALATVLAGALIPSRPSLLVVVVAIWAGCGACVGLRGGAHAWGVPLGGMLLATLLCGLVFSLRARDAEELEEVRAAAELASVHDPLTGVLNRRGLALLGEQIVSAARRGGDAVHCVLLEIDDLAAINDAAGHRAGDDLLVAVADVLRAATRATDAVARCDGDTFCVVGPGPGPGALELERRVRRDLAEAPSVPPAVRPARVTAASVMLAPWDTGHLEALLARAATELRARRALRGRAAISDAGPTTPRVP